MPISPTFQEERRLWRKGFYRVLGVDEVGRGPVAGNVTVAGVLFPATFNINNATGTESRKRRGKLKKFLSRIKDSKQLSGKKRGEIFTETKEYPEIEWHVANVSSKVIDRINIQRAIRRAVIRVIKKFNPRPDFVILDGNWFTFRSPAVPDYICIIQADEKVMSCALASVIAKVIRDRAMVRLAKRFPCYGFENHKGYATKTHRAALKKFGPCEIHRKTFLENILYLTDL